MHPGERRRPLRLLSIAGSDSSGGAGIQADLKTFAVHGAYGMSAVTAVTAQNTRQVWAIHLVPAAMVAAQIDAVLSDIGADAVKIGMLAEASIVRVVAERLRAHCGAVPGAAPEIPIVLDPVLRATSGEALLSAEGVAALLEELLPLVTLVTPNLPELEVLSGSLTFDGSAAEGSAAWGQAAAESSAAWDESARLAAAALLARRGPAVLVKGGHCAEGPLEPPPEGPPAGSPPPRRPARRGAQVVDLLLAGGVPHRFVNPRLPGPSRHGTGCTLAAAIAARLAAGDALPHAVSGAIAYVRSAIASACDLGGGQPPVNHIHALEALT